MTTRSISFPRRIVGACTAIAGVMVATMGSTLSASAADTVKEAFTDGTIIFNARARYEHVDQDGFDDDATANTLRVRAGFETADYKGFKILVEGEHVERLSGKHDDTINGMDRPTIADPQGTEVNRIQLTYTGIPKTTITGGRQRINLGNQRFVGAVGWRQNEQTFDAIRFDNSAIKDVKTTYIYMFNVNRINGEYHPTAGDLKLKGHVFEADYTGLSFGTLKGYFHSFDFTDAPDSSTRTFGARFSGQQGVGEDVTIHYAAEFAHQTDAADNPGNYNADYYVLEGAVSWNGLKGTVGYEVLGGSDVAGFATPLATLHKWQGWADVFLNTPDTGIEDFYLSLGYNNANILKGLNATATWHDFSSEKSFGSYGSEIDLAVNLKVHDMLSVGVKFADYNAKGFSGDRKKIWFSLTSAI